MLNNNPNTFSQLPSNHDPVQMTPEEEKIYKECSKEAFVKRGIPYASVAACGAFCALKAGFLKPSATYGYTPILMTASFIGSVIGLVSYKAVCIQKILDLPNSALKQKLEASMKKYQNQFAIPKELAPEESHNEAQLPMVSSLQMDNYQSTNDFDSFSGVNTDGGQQDDFYTMEPLDKYPGISTTYDELRQNNRDDYVRSHTSRLSPRPDDSRFVRPTAPISGGTHRPFDHDRVPQYQLND